MSLKEPFMYKSCPKEISLGVKTYYFWEMTPGLWVWCRKIVETSKTCKILLQFRLFLAFKYLCPIRTKSGKYVHFLYLGPIRTNESQRAINAKKSSRKWLCWVYLDTNKHFHSKSRPNYTGLQWNFCWGQKLRFLKNDPRLPYLMSLRGGV